MKRLIIFLLLVAAMNLTGFAQEKYGRALNIGLGVGGYSGYYGYVGRSLPVLNLNYELDVARSFTLAPFISFYTLSNRYYWGNANTPSRYYRYRETVIPIGVKGTYYFDELLDANNNWDFYLAGSLGFSVVRSNWQDGYQGDQNYYNGARPLFLDIHIGAEYHFSDNLGVFLDLSSGVSTLGLAIH